MPEILQLVQLDRVQSVLRRIPDQTSIGAEVGVREGKMSAALLFMRPYLTLFMVDRWKVYPPEEPRPESEDPDYNDQEAIDRYYAQAMERTQAYVDRRRVLPIDSLEAAKCMPKRTLDFCFIDANHCYGPVKADIEAWEPAVREGGWLCGHDYGRADKPDYGVTQAVDEYVRQHGLTLETDVGYTWFVRLPDPRRSNPWID